MEGMKLINASEVVTSKKTSKVEIKKTKKSPMKIITEDNIKSVTDRVSKNDDVVRSDTVTVVRPKAVAKTDVVVESNLNSRSIRAIKLKEDVYYGPKNANKNKFVRMYKKLGLVWTTYVPLNGMTVDGWFNSDKSQYIIKLLEDGDFKRFKFYGCDEIYDYFVDLGGVVFDHTKEDSLSSNYQNNKVNSIVGIKDSPIGMNNIDNIDNQCNNIKSDDNLISGNVTNDTKDADEDYRFIGADLWSGYRTRQLLKRVPDNWGVKWK
jgi:hypothetical protein